jgi:hypothetical protein
VKKRDRKALALYIRSTADQMGLRDWDFNLLREPCDDDCNAQCRVIYGRKLADIRVSEHFREFDPARIRRTVVHELVHFHLAAATNSVEHDLDGHLSGQANGLFYSGWLRNLEYGVDGIATAWATTFPLIKWPKTKGK